MTVGSTLHLKVEDKKRKKKKRELLGCSVTLVRRDCRLPILDDGVGWDVVWDVIWGGAARLHKELGVVDCGGGLDLHVDPAPDLILQRV